MRTARKLALGLLGGGGASAPNAPSVSSAATSTSNIRTTITNIDPTATTLKIYRSTDNVSFSLLDTVAVTGTSQNYDDGTITAGTNYWYKVGANNAGGEGLSTSSKANTLTYQLISYWKLDEASGTRNDSFSTNHLTSNNSVGQAVGKLVNAGQFAVASNRYLSRASNASLQTGNIDFTFGAWIYLDSAPASELWIASKGTGTTWEWFLHYNTDSRIRFVIRNAEVVLATTFGVVTTSTWYYVLGWHDSGAGQIGVSVNNTQNTAARTTGPTAGNDDFRIGWGAGVSRHFDGRIDGAIFLKRLLVASEKTALVNGGTGFEGFLP